MIGRNTVFLLLLLTISLTGCRLWEMDDYGDYRYISYIKNSTSDTLRVTIGSVFSGYPIDTLITPSEMIELKGGIKVKNGDDVVRNIMFNNTTSELVQVFHNDALIISWEGIASEMPINVHHFFNFNSWDVELNGNEYTVVFTIYESDLTINTK